MFPISGLWLCTKEVIDQETPVLKHLSSGMESLQELQKFSEKAISTYERSQNLMPNVMQDKESLEKLENLKRVTKECDDFLKPKNDMEG